MTADELHTAAARLVAQRVEQGLTEKVAERGTLARIVSLLGEPEPQRQRGRRVAGRAE
jgi:hypothetical protein